MRNTSFERAHNDQSAPYSESNSIERLASDLRLPHLMKKSFKHPTALLFSTLGGVLALSGT